MRIANVVVSIGLFAGMFGIACSSTTERDAFPDTPAPTEAAPPGTETPVPPLGNDHVKTVPVTLTGTVFAPNGSLPVSNALVYFTSDKPADIPEGAYCDECVALPEGTFAVSAPDGTFTISSSMKTGKAYVVVQKGQFRRVRPITIEEEGTIELDKADTSLPSRSDKAKDDTVPKMLILKDNTDFDKIDESLQKLGINELRIEEDRSLLLNLEEMMKYHVIFVPCGNKTDKTAESLQAIDNIRQFVAAGGKFYATDWSYEFIRQPFGGYLSWQNESTTLGSAGSSTSWQAPAHAADEGLATWLAATGSASFQVLGNYTTIIGIGTMEGTDAKGEPAQITPKVWVTADKGTGDAYPTTVSFENSCGRVLFSTYHTEASESGPAELLAQEKALLYVLLEVGVCVGDRPGVN